MRILYGVQGTGNGHTTRARVMSTAFNKAGVSVDYLFSGRAPDRYFNMEPFGDYQTRQGLTLITDAGRVKLLKTVWKNNLLRLWQDVRKLDLSGYDLVITDFEPVTAWAARLQKVPSVGIAHQYAFYHRVPGTESAPWLKPAMKSIAPAQLEVGVHWHHFGHPILPPLIEPAPASLPVVAENILVYLPFESLDEIRYRLREFEQFCFVIYAAVEEEARTENLWIKPFSRLGFQEDLARCGGVIANAGFGLCSEALQAGKKLLVKPLRNQVEQSANAAALEQLGRATIMRQLDSSAIAEWLEQGSPVPINWPDTAGALVDWILAGRHEPMECLADRLWSELPLEVREQRASEALMSRQS
ncbi:MAG: hypothetical protein CMI01_10770 [Oceanospirillaceae bacterium]|nr:hypothetical protein [Oceanospirillaceae bacterium]